MSLGDPTRRARRRGATLLSPLVVAVTALSLLRCGARTTIEPEGDAGQGAQKDAAADAPKDSGALFDRAPMDVVTCVEGATPTMVPPGVLIGASVPPCAPGLAHPSVCCVGAEMGTRCSVEPTSPFRACDPEAGAFTYPDPSTCCSLADPSSCVTQDVDADFHADASTACSSNCPPGANYFFPQLPYPYSCDGGPDAQVIDAGDATFEVCECTTTSCCLLDYCYPAGAGCPTTGPFCGSCPAGWEAGSLRDLCCRTGPCGSECFSQAVAIDSVPNTPSCGAGTISGGPPCNCQTLDQQGNTYSAECADGGCSCQRNGVVVETVPFDASFCFPFPEAGDCLWNFNALVACGFPNAIVPVCDF